MEQAAYEAFRRELFEAIWRDLDPLEEEIENNEALPYDRLMPLLREMRAFGLTIPEEYGGVGLTMTQYLPVLGEFAKVQGGIRVVVHVHNSMAHALWELGDEVQRKAILPGCADGSKSVAFALTEPDHGSGADLGTTIVRDGDDYVINGRKWLITNSDFASHFIVFGKTDPGAGENGVSAVLVERDRPGLSIQALPETMGCKGGQHGLLTFADARVPVANLLGEEGRGLAQMEQALEISRVFIAATSLGTAERALELSLRQAKVRTTFGKPLAARQGIQRYLAEMATDVYALRNMISDAAEKWDRGLRIPAEASMCKLFGLEAVGRVTDRALLVFGGIGYTRTHPIERLYRDARLNWLEEGPPTIQYMVAAGALLNGYAWDR
ncbi:acyl-CoA dehydrogenase family protein [Pseudonocardia sp. NPDC046786]|uniref:acyl-CoA dehydrogenase family protein n=1 Tax=Pseudonocardia sp. NPDC046786 TaxID=3155471 RepID=UPI0033EA9034